MFNYTIETEIENGEYIYLSINFTDGDETYISEYRVWTKNLIMEKDNLENTQLKNMVDLLDKLKIQYGKIYDEYGKLNFIKIIK